MGPPARAANDCSCAAQRQGLSYVGDLSVEQEARRSLSPLRHPVIFVRQPGALDEPRREAALWASTHYETRC